MHFEIVTIFPELFGPFRSTGLLGKAVDRGTVRLEVHDLRDWADDKWRHVDDEPYGGGAGMVMQAAPVLAAVRELGAQAADRPHTVLLTPRGRVFDQSVARELAAVGHLIVLCGRYEGFDERITHILEPDEISIGDFVLGGGEVAAMVLIEAVARLIEGVVGDPNSVTDDSFTEGLLDHPCYTRPPEVEGLEVPEILRSGHHEAIRQWRLEQSVAATVTRRPDLVHDNWDMYSDEVRSMIQKLGGEPRKRRTSTPSE